MNLTWHRGGTGWRGLAIGGAVTVSAASVYGFWRAFAMAGPMATPMGPGPGGAWTLHGMPLADMPEMWVAAGGLVLVFLASVLRSRGPVPAARGDRPTRRMAVPRWVIAAVATACLTVDISKTSTLGFVIPGMRDEYGIGPSNASLIAVAGLSGTAMGALVFSRLMMRIKRRDTCLVAMLAFTATAMCGMMPTFTGNVAMCACMGTAVGGLAPMLITILSDLFPGGSRGAVVTALSLVATAAGYLIAAGSALWLEPAFGWRILWLIGVPTGILFAAMTPLIPEPGPREERTHNAALLAPDVLVSRSTMTVGLQCVFATVVGLLTFGLTTWVPTLAGTGGLSHAGTNGLLAGVAAVMVPCALALTLAYRRIGPVWLSVALAVGTAVFLVTLATSGATKGQPWLLAASLAGSLFAVNTMAAVFLPITADLAEARRRGGITGWVSFCNRLGGLTGPLVVSLIVSSVTDVLMAVGMLALLCGGIAAYMGRRHHTVRAAVVRERQAVGG